MNIISADVDGLSTLYSSTTGSDALTVDLSSMVAGRRYLIVGSFSGNTDSSRFLMNLKARYSNTPNNISAGQALSGMGSFENLGFVGGYYVSGTRLSVLNVFDCPVGHTSAHKLYITHSSDKAGTASRVGGNISVIDITDYTEGVDYFHGRNVDERTGSRAASQVQTVITNPTAGRWVVLGTAAAGHIPANGGGNTLSLRPQVKIQASGGVSYTGDDYREIEDGSGEAAHTDIYTSVEVHVGCPSLTITSSGGSNDLGVNTKAEPYSLANIAMAPSMMEVLTYKDADPTFTTIATVPTASVLAGDAVLILGSCEFFGSSVANYGVRYESFPAADVGEEHLIGVANNDASDINCMSVCITYVPSADTTVYARMTSLVSSNAFNLAIARFILPVTSTPVEIDGSATITVSTASAAVLQRHASMNASASITATTAAQAVVVKDVYKKITATASITTASTVDAVLYSILRQITADITTTTAADIVLVPTVTADAQVAVTTSASIVVLKTLVPDPAIVQTETFASALVMTTDYIDPEFNTPLGYLNTLLTDIQVQAKVGYYTEGRSILRYQLAEVTGYTPPVLEAGRNYNIGQPILEYMVSYAILGTDNVLVADRHYPLQLHQTTNTLVAKRHYQIEVGLAAPQQLIATRNYSVFRPSFEDELLQLINNERDLIGVQGHYTKFSGNDNVENVAHSHAVNMDAYDAYGHEDEGYRDGYQTVEQRLGLLAPWYATMGSENCAAATSPTLLDMNGEVTAQAFFEGWRNSAGHYANMVFDWIELTGDPDVAVEMMLGLESVTVDHVRDVYHGTYINYKPNAVMVTYAVTNFIISPRSIAVPTQAAYSRHYELQAPTTAIMERRYELQAYNHVTKSLESNYGQAVSASLDVAYSTTIARDFVAPIGWKVGRNIEARYSGNTTVKAELTSWYNILEGVPVGRDFVAPYSLKISRALDVAYSTSKPTGRSFTSHYSVAARIAKTFEVPYDTARAVVRSLDVAYGSAAVLSREFIGSYGSMKLISQNMDVAYGTPKEVAKSFDAAYSQNVGVVRSLEGTYHLTLPTGRNLDSGMDLLPLNPVASALDIRYHLLGSNVTVTTGGASIMVNGAVHPIDTVEIGTTEDDAYWKGRITIKDANLFSHLRKGTKFTLNFFGLTYNLIVDARSTNRGGIASIDRTVEVSTVASLRGASTTPTVTYVNESAKMAHSLAEELLGSSIQWDMVDWSIPAFRYSVEGVSPIEAAKVVVEAAGGVLISDTLGAFIAQPKHRLSYDDYDGNGEVSISDAYDVLTQNETADFADVRNKFRITESLAAFGDRIEYLPDSYADGSQANYGDLLVYPSPWRESIEVRTTSGANVGLVFSAIIEREEEATVEIVRGEGTTSYPISDVLEVTWLSEPLGGIAWDDYAVNITTPVNVNEGYGLIKIRYKTKAIVYKTTLPIDVEVQFIVEDTSNG